MPPMAWGALTRFIPMPPRVFQTLTLRAVQSPRNPTQVLQNEMQVHGTWNAVDPASVVSSGDHLMVKYGPNADSEVSKDGRGNKGKEAPEQPQPTNPKITSSSAFNCCILLYIRVEY